MDVWGWLIGYLVLFALIHLALYYVYVHRSDDEPSGTSSVPEQNGLWSSPGSEPTERTSVADSHERLHAVDGETVDCAYCGAANESDPAFSKCWNCLSMLR